MFSNRFNWPYLVSVGLILSIALTNCTSSGSGQDLEVKGSWARAGTIDTPGAVYLQVVNRGKQEKTLTAGSSPDCEAVELHETVKLEDGVMGMEPVEEGIRIPPGEQIRLEPGGYHFMCIGKSRAFEAGTSLPFTVFFQSFGALELTIPIRAAE